MVMVEELSLALNVDARAVGFWNNVLYLFGSEDEVRSLLDECTGKSRREIDKYITKKRIEKIKDEKYSSIDEFIACFNGDKKSALERLFQEPIDISKMSKLITDDPIRIFKIHSTLPIAVWFMSFVVYL